MLGSNTKNFLTLSQPLLKPSKSALANKAHTTSLASSSFEQSNLSGCRRYFSRKVILVSWAKHPLSSARFSSSEIRFSLPIHRKQEAFAEHAHAVLTGLKMIDSSVRPEHIVVFPEREFMPNSAVEISLPAGKHFKYMGANVRVKFEWSNGGNYHVWYIPESA
jgi:hypothetical protein